MIRLDGHVALVTGGSRGIGRATALLLARAGAAVALSFRERRDAAERVASEIRDVRGRAVALQADLTRAEDAEALAAGASALGPISIVVANAGTWRPTRFPSFDVEEWDRLVRENLTSKALTIRAALPRCRADARFVLVSSTAGQRGEAGHGAYAAAQGGTVALVKSLATELGPRGMRVNGVAPGWVRTDMAAAALARDESEIVKGIPTGRVAEPDDVAGPIAFLCSDLARHVQGEMLCVNGGSLLFVK